MTYVWIFLGSYSVTFAITFFMMSRRVASSADVMRKNGISQEAIDDMYKQMGAPTAVALIQTTLIAGTALGGIASLIVWLATS